MDEVMLLSTTGIKPAVWSVYSCKQYGAGSRGGGWVVGVECWHEGQTRGRAEGRRQQHKVTRRSTGFDVRGQLSSFT
jgi:hypothetical protein